MKLHSRRRSLSRGSEEYFDRLCRISTATPLVEDTWLYTWTGYPPEPFLRHKTVFRQSTPSEISKKELTVLKPAAKEIANIFGVQKPDAHNDHMLDAELRSAGFEWLSLNRYPSKACLVGICGNYVVGATKLSQKRLDFIPAEQWGLLHRNKDAKNKQYRAGYRHFLAKFDVGYSFATERHGLPCLVSYTVDIGVHGLGYIWAMISVADSTIPVPYRIPLTTGVDGILEKVEQLNNGCKDLIGRLDWAFLQKHGRKSVFNWISEQIEGTCVPFSVLESLRKDPHICECVTRLDALLAIIKTLYCKSDDTLLTLVPLVQKLNAREEVYHD